MDADRTALEEGGDLLASKLGYAVIGAAFEVHNELGGGLLEPIYQEAFERELRRSQIPFSAQEKLTVYYKGEPLEKRYSPDVTIDGRMIVEIKAVKALAPEHDAQLLNYLRITRMRVGYLINFGSVSKVEWKRFVL